MADRPSRRQEKKGALFFIGRWAWIFLLGELILLLSMFLFANNDTLHPQVVACAVCMLIGILTALLTRRVLVKHSLFVRILFPALTLLICIVGINWLTAGQAGIGFQNDVLYGSPLLGLIPLGTGLLGIVLTLLAWTKKKKRKSHRAARPTPFEDGQPGATTPRSTQPTAAASSATADLPSIITGRVAPIVRGSNGRTPTPSTPRRNPRSSPPTTRAVKKKTKNKHLRLIGAEEHRCPYCLELVQPNDRRGVVICEVCHAYHHKDCWDVTGRCQVPHQSNT